MIDERRGAARRYFVAALPGWILAAVVAYVLSATADVPLWAPLIVLALWIATDVATFPKRRRFYESQPAAHRMLNEPGVALTEVTAKGFARVRGEIWQVRPLEPGEVIAKGQPVRVRAIDGLTLLVEGD